MSIQHLHIKVASKQNRACGHSRQQPPHHITDVYTCSSNTEARQGTKCQRHYRGVVGVMEPLHKRCEVPWQGDSIGCAKSLQRSSRRTTQRNFWHPLRDENSMLNHFETCGTRKARESHAREDTRLPCCIDLGHSIFLSSERTCPN